MGFKHGPFLIEQKFVEISSDSCRTVLVTKCGAEFFNGIRQEFCPGWVLQLEATGIKLLGVPERFVDDSPGPPSEGCLFGRLDDSLRILNPQGKTDAADFVDVETRVNVLLARPKAREPTNILDLSEARS